MKMQFGILLGSIFLIACGPAPGNDSQLDSVVFRGNLWPDPKSIPVCLVNPEQVDSSLRDDIKNHTSQEFSKKAGINLVGWNACERRDFQSEMIRIYFEPSFNWQSFGSTVYAGGGRSAIGRSSFSCGSDCNGGTMKLKIGQQGRYPGPENPMRDFIITQTRATAVHEFGHALGLLHEHARLDAPGCGDFDERIAHNNSRGVVYVGEYDPQSIMNYCHDRSLTSLSSGDVAGLRFLYPNASQIDRSQDPQLPQEPQEPQEPEVDKKPNPPQTVDVKNDTCNPTAALSPQLEKTLTSGPRKTVGFVNHCKHPLQAYWTNYRGEEVSYGLIPANETRYFYTYEGHVWRFRHEANAKLVKEFKIADWMTTVALP